MIENIQNNHIAHAMGKSTTSHADMTSRSATDNSDATLHVRFADMVSQALQTAPADADAVQKAHELLQSGRLTTPENIRSAAENLLNFGV